MGDCALVTFLQLTCFTKQEVLQFSNRASGISIRYLNDQSYGWCASSLSLATDARRPAR
jgi:hypothetical protein